MVRKPESSGNANLPTYEQYIRESISITIAKIKDGIYEEACNRLAELSDNLNYGNLHKNTVYLHEKIVVYHDALRQTNAESWAWHLCSVGAAYTILGKFDKAFEILEEMKLIGSTICDEDIESTAIQNLANAKYYSGERGEAKQLYESAATTKARIGDKRGLAQLQNNLASMAIEDGRLDEAQALIDSSLMIKRRLRDSEEIGAAYGTLGNLAVAKLDYRNARRYYTKGLQIATKHANIDNIALSHLNLGNVLLELGDVDKSLKHYYDGLEIVKKQELPYTEGMLLQALAVAHNRIGCYKDSFEYFCMLAKIKRQLSGHFDEAMAYHDAAVVLIQADKITEGIDYYKKAIAGFHRTDNPEWQARCLWEMANAMVKVDMANECRSAIRRCLMILKNRQLWDQLKDAYVAGCFAFFDMGRPDWAGKLFSKERVFLRDHSEPIYLAQRLTEVANLYLDYCRPKRAINLFSEALCIYRQLNDYTLESLVRNDLGQAYLDNGQLNRSEQEFVYLIKRSDETHDRALKLLALTNLAEVKRRNDELESAIELGAQCVNLADQINDWRGLALVLNNLGLAYEAVGDIKKARDHFKRSARLAHKQYDSAAEARALSSLGTLEAERGRYDKALSLYDMAISKLNEDNELILDLLENRLMCLIEMENEEEASRTAERAIDIASKRSNFKRAEDIALRVAFANFDDCSLESAAMALVSSMCYAAARGQKAIEDHFAIWITLLHDTDDRPYSRMELCAAIKDAVEQVIPNYTSIINDLLNTIINILETNDLNE